MARRRGDSQRLDKENPNTDRSNVFQCSVEQQDTTAHNDLGYILWIT